MIWVVSQLYILLRVMIVKKSEEIDYRLIVISLKA